MCCITICCIGGATPEASTIKTFREPSATSTPLRRNAAKRCDENNTQKKTSASFREPGNLYVFKHLPRTFRMACLKPSASFRDSNDNCEHGPSHGVNFAKSLQITAIIAFPQNLPRPSAKYKIPKLK